MWEKTRSSIVNCGIKGRFLTEEQSHTDGKASRVTTRQQFRTSAKGVRFLHT